VDSFDTMAKIAGKTFSYSHSTNHLFDKLNMKMMIVAGQFQNQQIQVHANHYWQV